MNRKVLENVNALASVHLHICTVKKLNSVEQEEKRQNAKTGLEHHLLVLRYTKTCYDDFLSKLLILTTNLGTLRALSH